MKEPIFKELLHQIEESTQEIVAMTTDPIEVEGIPMREEDHLMMEDIPTEIGDLQEEEDHKIMEDPQWTQRAPNEGGPPGEGGPLDDEGSPNGNGGPPRCPDRRGPPGPRGPPGLVGPVIVQQPQVILDTTTLKIHLTIWDNQCYTWLGYKIR